MTDADRVRLLFGPYRPPPLCRGDRAFCLFRGCDVVIIGWTNALIPWPRCRPFGTRGGGWGILIDEELGRSIRNESAVALKYWWRASRNTVWKWRQVLDVGRVDAEGSRRLIQAAAQAGAEVIKGREFSEEERAAKRRIALELNLGQYVGPGNNAPLWTAEELALLRAMPDDKLGKKLGRTQNAVRLKRTRSDIPKPHDGKKRKRKRR